MRIHLRSFIIEHGHIQAGSVNSKQVWQGQDRRVVLGRGSTISKQYPTRARQRDNSGIRAIIQTRCKQSPKGKAIRVNPENTAGIKHGKLTRQTDN